MSTDTANVYNERKLVFDENGKQSVIEMGHKLRLGGSRPCRAYVDPGGRQRGGLYSIRRWILSRVITQDNWFCTSSFNVSFLTFLKLKYWPSASA
jgi:hypothetical protein